MFPALANGRATKRGGSGCFGTKVTNPAFAHRADRRAKPINIAQLEAVIQRVRANASLGSLIPGRTASRWQHKAGEVAIRWHARVDFMHA